MENKIKKINKKQTIVSVVCFVVLIIIAMAVFIPLIIKKDGNKENGNNASVEKVEELYKTIDDLTNDNNSLKDENTALKQDNVELNKIKDLYENSGDKAEELQGIVNKYFETGELVGTEHYAVVRFYCPYLLSTQKVVEKGQCVSVDNPIDPNSKIIFKSWQLDGVDFDCESTPITSDISLEADYDQYYTMTFVSYDIGGYTEFKRSESLVLSGSVVTFPDYSEYVPNGYIFDGWSLWNDLIDTKNLIAENDFVFVAKYSLSNLNSVVEKSWGNGFAPQGADCIWTDGIDTYYSSFNGQYVLNKTTGFWDEKVWDASSSLQVFSAQYIWQDGENIYYSNADQQYVLDKANYKWVEKTWKGLNQPYRFYIWQDGGNTFYSHNEEQYVLDSATDTWIVKTWNGLSPYFARDIWTDGINVYHTKDYDTYVLDTETSTWSECLDVFPIFGFSPSKFWTDGNVYYYSDGTSHYYYDTNTNTWLEKSWFTEFGLYGNNVWTDGENFYYSEYAQQYVICRKDLV